MRTKLLVLSLLTGLSLFNAKLTQALEDTQSLTLESIFASGEFRNKSVQNVQWDSDGSNFTFTKQTQVLASWIFTDTTFPPIAVDYLL